MAALYTHTTGHVLTVHLPAEMNLTGLTFYGRVQKPDGSSLRKTLVVDSELKTVSYTTASGDLDQAGEYMLRVWVVSTGKEYLLDPLFFRVWPHDREGY